MQPLEERLKKFLEENSLKKISKIAKGWSSEIYLVENEKGKKFALKIEREKSPRMNMVKKEAENLRLANSSGMGPKFIDADFEKRIILMQYIPGKTFEEWLFESNPSREEVQHVLQELFFQARELDKIGLDHGQLAGRGKNILISGKSPVIIDFEKASANRKTHNVTTLHSFLCSNPNSAIAKRVKGILNTTSPNALKTVK